MAVAHLFGDRLCDFVELLLILLLLLMVSRVAFLLLFHVFLVLFFQKFVFRLVGDHLKEAKRLCQVP